MSSTGVQDFAVGTVRVSKLSMMLGLQVGVTGRDTFFSPLYICDVCSSQREAQ